MTWKKLDRGRYELIGTDYRVEAAYEDNATDGHYARTGNFTIGRTEWALVRVSRDENLDWFETMRDAKAEAERLAKQDKRPDPIAFGAAAVEAGTPDFETNDPQTNLADTLANLMHWADRDGPDFELALDAARKYFAEEIRS